MLGIYCNLRNIVAQVKKKNSVREAGESGLWYLNEESLNSGNKSYSHHGRPDVFPHVFVRKP